MVTCGRSTHLDVAVPEGQSHIGAILQQRMPGFEPDVIVVFDDSNPLEFSGLDEVAVPIFYYSVDVHHHVDRHRELLPLVDDMWVAMSDYADRLQIDGKPAQTMPLWASRFYEPAPERTYGATFVGTMNPKLNLERVVFFEQLKRKAPVEVLTGEYTSIFSRSTVVINQTVKGDLNFRVFEAMLSGALLITEKTGNGLLDLFTDGTHLVTYARGDADDAAEKIAYYVAHPDEALAIGSRGRAEILAKHLPVHRAECLIGHLKQLQKRSSPNRSLASMFNLACLAKAKRTSPPNLGYLEALTAANRALERAIQQREELTTLQSGYATLVALEFDLVARKGTGASLLRQAAIAWPGVPVFYFAVLRDLLNQGHISTAEQYAAEIFEEPPEVLFPRVEEGIRLLLKAHGWELPSMVPC